MARGPAASKKAELSGGENVEIPKTLDAESGAKPEQSRPSLAEAIKQHAEAVDKLANNLAMLAGQGPQVDPVAKIVSADIGSNTLLSQLVQKVSFAQPDTGADLTSAIPPVNIMHEMSLCLPDAGVNRQTPLTKYVTGGPLVIIQFFMARVNGWGAFQHRGMALGVPDIRSAQVIGHLTAVLAAEAMSMNLPVVPKSW